jgi:hypothetical protein
MKEAKLTHDEKVIGTLSPVRLESNFGKMVMYFCPVDHLQVTERISAGDGGSLPAEAVAIGLSVPTDLKPGLYDLKNVEIHSNGVMSVKATPKTEWKLV